VQLNGQRKVVGVLRGYDPFMNIVLDEAVEVVSATERNNLGMIVREAAPIPLGHRTGNSKLIAGHYNVPSMRGGGTRAGRPREQRCCDGGAGLCATLCKMTAPAPILLDRGEQQRLLYSCCWTCEWANEAAARRINRQFM